MGFFNFIKNVGKKVVGGVAKVAKVVGSGVAKVAPIVSKVAGMIPDPRAQALSKIAGTVGGVAGKFFNKKPPEEEPAQAEQISQPVHHDRAPPRREEHYGRGRYEEHYGRGRHEESYGRHHYGRHEDYGRHHHGRR